MTLNVHSRGGGGSDKEMHIVVHRQHASEIAVAAFAIADNSAYHRERRPRRPPPRGAPAPRPRDVTRAVHVLVFVARDTHATTARQRFN